MCCICGTIGDEGATLIAGRLASNGLLTTLDLAANGIGDAGAAALAEGLKLNTTLQRLDLRCAPYTCAWLPHIFFAHLAGCCTVMFHHTMRFD